MANVPVLVLSSALTVTVISGSILSWQYLDKKDALQISEKKLLVLNEETSSLKNQIRNNNERLEELESAKEVNSKQRSELQDVIETKDQTLSEFEQKLSELESTFEGKKKTEANLKAQLSKKNQTLSEFKQKLSDLENAFDEKKKTEETLRDELSNKDQTLSGFEHKLSKLENTFEDNKKTETIIRAELSMKDQKLSGFEQKLSELENAFDEKKETEATLKAELSMKDQTLSEFEQKFNELESVFEEKKETEAALRSDLSKRDQTLAEFKQKLSELKNAFEEEKTTKIQGLLGQLADIQGEKSEVENKLGQMKSTYDTIVLDLKKQIKNKEVSIKAFEKRISVSFVNRILFKLGVATITPKGRKILEKVGEILKDVRDRQIRVEGHTDDIPIHSVTRHKFPSNWELSAARAAAVVRYFEKKIGLDPTNLEAVGRSFYEPVASNETEEGRARNRRVNIIIAPKIN